jgi:glycosyltransferase involved in cell wall biosynthesis
MKILTNMAFWQSPEWLERTDSIYPLTPGGGDPDFLPWWREAWTLYRRRRGYDVVLTMGIRESIAYAFLCWITGAAPRQIMTEIFIDSPAHGNVLWRMKTALYRRLARRAIGIITNSTAEIATNAARFDLPHERFRYVPLNTTIEHPEYLPAPDGYLFCAGRTLRDYATLRRVIEATDLPWHIVAGADDLRDAPLPDRVTVHREIDRSRYLDLLRGARLVVLPLLPTERATGQVVVLEAMSYGKPVLTTRAPGTIDLIRDGETGRLIAPGAAGAMIAATDLLLADPIEAERIGRAGFTTVLHHHATPTHSEARLAAISALVNLFNPTRP